MPALCSACLRDDVCRCCPPHLQCARRVSASFFCRGLVCFVLRYHSAWRAFTQKLLRACASLAEVCPCACLNQQHARARASGRSKPTVLIGGFAEPDFEHLMELLVRVRENPREARAKGRKVSVAAQPCGAL